MLNLGKAKELLISFIWEVDLKTLPRWRASLYFVARMLYLAIRDLADGQLNLRAMSLVYTTLLSLVPLLAVSFSVLKAFGVHNQIEPWLLSVFAQLGDRGPEVTSRIIGFVDNVRVGFLGSVGLAFLFYTVVSLIQKIERAFNYTWRVKQDRPFAQRFSDYLTVIMIGPVLIFAALGITASVSSTTVVQAMMQIEPFGTLIEWVSRLVPYGLIILAFTFVYLVVPNTRVKVTSALMGAAVAGFLWQTVGWGFTKFMVSSAKYTAIYSGFATLVIFMIWLYLAWLILLVGANLAFYFQNRQHMVPFRREYRLSIRLQERLAFVVMRLIGRSHYQGEPGWSAQRLAQHLAMPQDTVESVLVALQQGGMIAATRGEPPTYVPASPLETVPLKSLLDIVRSADEPARPDLRRVPHEATIDHLIRQADDAVAEAFDGLTLKDLALAEASAPSTTETLRPAQDQVV